MKVAVKVTLPVVTVEPEAGLKAKLPATVVDAFNCVIERVVPVTTGAGVNQSITGVIFDTEIVCVVVIELGLVIV